MSLQPTFFDQAALLYRLSGALRDAKQEVVFLVGSPLSAPIAANGLGVPDVPGIIDLIRRTFSSDPAQLAYFDQAVSATPEESYQAAFHFLQGRRGQSKSNDIILSAVLSARTHPVVGEKPNPLDEDACALLELNSNNWHISPATASLASLITVYPEFFGRSILTTNFDPLIEIAIHKAGGSKYRTVLSADGNITQTVADGCRVVHLHGYWFGSDTLHTKRQLARPFPRSFVRVGRLLLESFDWIDEYFKYPKFDEVFDLLLRMLSNIGEHREAEDLLEGFEETVKERNARFIHFCQMKTYSLWIQANFQEAIKWGRIGKELKESSFVDTVSNVEHNLALAERDAGNPEVALHEFLLGKALEEILDPEELDEAKDGSQYGNIGRCLQFMGQIDSALVCYQKSAILLEKNSKYENTLNQGYIRLWVGEVLVARGQIGLGTKLIEAARRKWEKISPFLAAQATRLLGELVREDSTPLSDAEIDVESTFENWILGEDLDKAETLPRRWIG